MPASQTTILLAAHPDRTRDALQALLTAETELQMELADDVGMILETMVEALPDVVLLDTNLQNGATPDLLEQIKEAAPDTPCVTVVDSRKQARQARTAGADVVLARGFATRQLVTAIENLVPETAGVTL